MKNSIRISFIFIFLISLLGITSPQLVRAATEWVVTNTNNSGAGSLRQAIADGSNGDTITFDPSLGGQTIHLASVLEVDKSITIDGSTLASQITISGDDLHRVFYVNSGVTFTLDSLIIVHGKSPYNSMGGGIFNAGALTVTNSTISENSAANGAGIFNQGGTVTMIDSSLSYNDAYMEGSGLYNEGGTVTMSYSTLSHNNVSYTGGGFYNAGGTVTIDHSTFSDNTGDPLYSSYAGGIYNSGTLTISDSTFSNNSAQSSGGGIFHANGTLTIMNSLFSGNSISGYHGGGGGIINNDTLIIINSTFSGNSAESGGAIYNNGSLGMLTVTDSTFSDNSAQDGGGIFNYGALTVTNSTFSGNGTSDYDSVGGGISNYDAADVINSTFSGNSAYTGGGIHNWDALTVTNSTFFANVAVWGGGIANSGYGVGGELRVKNSTFSANGAQHGGGIANMFIAYQKSMLHYTNTIIANSTSGGDCYNVGDIGTNLNNLVEDGSCSAAMSGEPHLGALADNGGPTQTMALLAGSPAINAGDNSICAAPPVNNLDQRGISRPEGNACEVGAYEVDIPIVASIKRLDSNPTSTSVLNFQVTFSESVIGVDDEEPFSDFMLTTTSVIGAFISAVNGSEDTYIVTVNAGSGDGTIRLDVPIDAIITDLAENPLGDLPFTRGEVYRILTTFTSIGSPDGWILESTETSGVGGTKNNTASTFNLGDDAANRQYRAILSFNTASLPDNAVITKVTLKVKRQGVTGGGNPITTFGGFMADIKKGTFGKAGLQLTDFNAKAGKTLGAFKPKLNSGWYSINLTNGKGQINKVGLTQIRLRFKLDDNNNNIANFLKLYNGNAGAANRPQLIIEYTIP